MIKSFEEVAEAMASALEKHANTIIAKYEAIANEIERITDIINKSNELGK
jgi:hypothetical protein